MVHHRWRKVLSLVRWVLDLPLLLLLLVESSEEAAHFIKSIIN